MKKILIITIIISAFSLYSCEEADRIDFINDSPDIPMQVTDMNITPTAGGAILTYKIPEDPVFSCVKAVYEIQPNVYREAKASRYMDTLRLVGFGDTLQHKVTVFSIGENEKKSESTTFLFNPLIPPVNSVFDSLDLSATFGGVNVKFVNRSKADIKIEVIVDSLGTGDWENATTFYTAAEEGSFSIRGYSCREMKFATFIRDRWNNKSDTLVKSLTPMYEQEISKKNWEYVPFDGAQGQAVFGVNIPSHLWNNNVSFGDVFACDGNLQLPIWFSVDFGEKVVLSRFKLWHRPSREYNSMKYFEVWGTNAPSLDGSFDNWILLGSFESFKPSGLPVGTVSPEDRAYASGTGADFEFKPGLPAVRYWRLVDIDGWTSGNSTMQYSEISFWGQPVTE